MRVVSPRVRLVILFGGRSAEHEVSCISARHVLAAADPTKYQIEPVGITRDGRWVHAEDAAEALQAGDGELPKVLTASGPTIDALEVLDTDYKPANPDQSTPHLHPKTQPDHTPPQTNDTTPYPDFEPSVTVVFPVMHGPMGEDGTIQGLLELAGVAYVGAGVLASSLCMNKVACKQMLASSGIGVGKYRWFTFDEDTVRTSEGDRSSVLREAEQATNDFGLPLFVKPANMGSSIGVSRATDLDSVTNAVRLAATYDRTVIIEEAIRGREIEISVLGNSDPVASVAGEILPGADFYDYRDKYQSGAELLVPAPLSDEELARLQGIAIASYRACRVEGLARVDFLYEDGSVDPAANRGWLVNEINTMPGFTPISLYPKLWSVTGLDYPSLIDKLIALAISRHQRNALHARTDHQS